MSKHPSTRFDQLRAMREAQFALNEAKQKQAAKMAAVADSAPDEPSSDATKPERPAGTAAKPKKATVAKPETKRVAKKSASAETTSAKPKSAKPKKAGR